jgi:hypothetical protein
MSLLLALTGERLFYVAYPSALAAPDADQVREGKDSTGAYATAWDNVDPPANGVFDWPTDAAGLTAATTYRVAFTHQAPATLVVVSDVFTTLGGAVAAIVLVAGYLQYLTAAGGSDMKVYLTAAGGLEAKTSAGVGDRLLTLSAGQLVAT